MCTGRKNSRCCNLQAWCLVKLPLLCIPDDSSVLIKRCLGSQLSQCCAVAMSRILCLGQKNVNLSISKFKWHLQTSLAVAGNKHKTDHTTLNWHTLNQNVYDMHIYNTSQMKLRVLFLHWQRECLSYNQNHTLFDAFAFLSIAMNCTHFNEMLVPW